MNKENSRFGYTGLSDAQVKSSFEKYGNNRLSEKKNKSLFKKMIENLMDPIVKILICALIANIIFTFKNINWAECGGIVLAIIISTLVSTLSERGSEKAFQKLKSQSSKGTYTVIRNGNDRLISINDIVVGDIIILGAGELIPCDGRIISGEITVDQSAVNGESAEVRKYCTNSKKVFAPDNCECIFRGSLVASGSCIIRAEHVGDNTMYGKIASELVIETRTSPLKLRLEKLASTVSKIGYFAAATVALAYLFNVFILDSNFNTHLIMLKFQDWRFIASSLIKGITIAITVIVVSVPEGLPMMITVVLSSNMKKMLKDNVLIRKPVGIETAGSINILFTDKTGTITSGALTVDEVILANNKHYKNIKQIECDRISNLFISSVMYNTEAVFTSNGEIAGGNSTERALLRFVGNKNANDKVISKKPFDSKNKFSCAQLSDLTLYKGAPEKIIPLCDHYYDENGCICEFNNKNAVLQQVYKLSRESNRIIAMSVKPNGSSATLPCSMIFVCIVKIKDKIRKEAKSAIQNLKSAGIQTVMITGDSAPTAKAIALESGIFTDLGQNIIIDGESLSKMTDQEIKNRLKNIRVICRALPSDKSRLVKIAQDMGLVVGMTGDGVNDAPALKNADVGFSVGSGTDIAKEASDIVILDDNLASIEKAVLYGRTIFKNIRKFILFQLTMNLCAVGVTLFGQLMGIDNPVTVIQMLWINIIMDTLGGLAFAGEAPIKNYMKEKTKKRDEPIVTKRMLLRVLTMGGYAIFMCSMFLKSEKMRELYGYYNNPIYFLAAFFALFIFTGIAICFVSRSERFFFLANISKNKPFIIIMVIVLIIQLSMIYFGGSIFRCAPLTISQLAIVGLLSLSVILFDLIRKIIVKFLKKS